ncbi:oxidoreductase [Sphingomonas spermidinifaciens]|uniref:Oxidoreductase n=1 Tax=Sphingomonas spermidinifaciens TaxID=1141889 RepID=A0A2A4B4A3_9SPHN|nr:aldo/keto reductase [Sphingomonas spermidinifaciens]PCD03271.1 oxidoreductase [Sphingomonas spermidinifaciens]
MLDLNDGNRIPALGFGTWQIPDAQAGLIVRKAADIGYKLIDTAAIYQNERGVGEGLASVEDVFLTTKLWNDRHEDAEAALDESLALLGRESVDLYLIHWPVAGSEAYLTAWETLIRLREAGRTRSIGVSNFLPEQIERLVSATGVTPVLNQIELHPRFQQAEARAFHAEHGIVTQSWSPLGKGGLISDPTILGIAEKHGATGAQVILAWHLALGLSVIPKASDEAHARDNFGAAGVTLDDEDMAAIAGLDDPDGRTGPDPRSFGN